MIRYFARLTRPAVIVFDPVDGFARDLRHRGEKPRPLGRVWFDLAERQVGDAWERFPDAVELHTVENPSGYHLFSGRRRGVRRGVRLDLAPGRYRVRVGSDYYQPVVVEAAVPPADPRVPVGVDLRPGYRYPFPPGRPPSGLPGPTLVYGALRNSDGSMMAGAVVVARFQWPPPSPANPSPPFLRQTCRTDAAGQWVIPLPDPPPDPDGPPLTRTGLTLAAALPDGRTVRLPVPNDRVDLGRTTTMRQTALLGRVMGRGGRPVGGAAITVDEEPAGRASSRPDGTWAFYMRPSLRPGQTATVTVTAAAGAAAVARQLTIQTGTDNAVGVFELDR